MKKETDDLKKEINDYLKNEPQLKEALKLFNISNSQYMDAIKVSSGQDRYISTKGTNV